MSLKNSDLMIVRSFPYPNSTEKVQAAINKFVEVIYRPNVDMIRVMRAIKKAQKLWMFLPVYIRSLSEEEKKMVEEGMDIMMNQDRIKEKEEYMKNASADEKNNLRYLFFLDRLENFDVNPSWTWKGL